jgi:hypothetical protein
MQGGRITICRRQENKKQIYLLFWSMTSPVFNPLKEPVYGKILIPLIMSIMSKHVGFNHLGFNSPPLAASCHSGESRNPEIYTGCRIRSGMTSDTPLLCGGVVH